MEINIFQILILLLLFFPLIKRFLDSLSEDQNKEEETDQPADPWAGGQEQDSYSLPWEDDDYRQRRTAESPQDRPASRQPESQPTATRQPETPPASARDTGEQSWEEFFEGLENVLSGGETQDARREAPPAATTGRQTQGQHTGTRQESRRDESRRHVSHRQESRRHETSRPQDPFHYNRDTGTDISDQVAGELEAEDNPIYASLDTGPEVAVIGRSGRKNVKRILHHPEKLRDGIILKEILGPPKSRRAKYY